MALPNFAYQFAGPNVYIPSNMSGMAGGQLIIDFSRNQAKYPVNQWLAIRKVDRTDGRYTLLQPADAARVTSLQESIWPRGQKRPAGNIKTSSHTFLPWNTNRYNESFTLDQSQVEQASWPMLVQHAQSAASRAMRLRALLAATALANGNWSSWGHQATAQALNNSVGFWGAGTSANPTILPTLQQVQIKIVEDTNETVDLADMIGIVNPDTAAKLALSQEIRDYVKNTPYALSFLKFDGSNGGPTMTEMYGMPNPLYGLKFAVDNSTVVTSKRNAAATVRNFIIPDNTCYVVSRPAGIGGTGVGTDFSTVTAFCYSEFEMEDFFSPRDRLYEGNVSQDIDIQIVAPSSGYLITNLFS